MKKIFLGISILGLFLSIYANKIDIGKYDMLFQKYGDIYAIKESHGKDIHIKTRPKEKANDYFLLWSCKSFRIEKT